MNIALIGHGGMNQAIEQIALERGHTITCIIDQGDDLVGADLSDIDVAIEFTQPDAALVNVEVLAQKGVTTLCGTTGWNDSLEKAHEAASQAGIGFLWSPNFAIGVNLFWKTVAEAARLYDPFDDFDVAVHEWHHTKKKDSPSGTGVKAGEVILENMSRKNSMVTDRLDRSPNADELHVSSTRVGSVPGTHTVSFDGPFDTLEITHTSRSKAAFASGAVLAAEWLAGKQGVFTMDDFLESLTTNS